MFKKFCSAVVTIGLLSFGSAFASDCCAKSIAVDKTVCADMPDTKGPFPEDNSRD